MIVVPPWFTRQTPLPIDCDVIVGTGYDGGSGARGRRRRGEVGSGVSIWYASTYSLRKSTLR